MTVTVPVVEGSVSVTEATPDELLPGGTTLRSELLEGFSLDVARFFPFAHTPAGDGS